MPSHEDIRQVRSSVLSSPVAGLLIAPQSFLNFTSTSEGFEATDSGADSGAPDLEERANELGLSIVSEEPGGGVSVQVRMDNAYD